MKYFKHFIIIVTACCVLLLVAGCEVNTNKVSNVQLDVETLPNKITIGDFDIRQAQLIVTYTDATSSVVSVTYAMLEAADLAKFQTVGNHSVTITYLTYVLVYTFEVVAPTEAEVKEQVEVVKNSIIISEIVTSDFALVTKVGEVSISWSSSDAAIKIENGVAKVTRPDLSDNDVYVVLTAVFSKYGYDFEHQYNVVVNKYTIDEYQQLIDNVASSIIVPATTHNELVLPFDVINQPGITIEWTSNNPAIVIDNVAKTVVVNEVEEDTVVVLSYKIIYKGNVFDGFANKTITVLAPVSIVQAPKPTNVLLSGNTLTFTKVSGIAKYNIYVDGIAVLETTTNSINLLALIVENGTYVIGVQSIASGVYNLDSDIVTVNYTKDTIGYEGTYYSGIDLTKTGQTLYDSLTTLLTNTHDYRNGSRQNYESLKTDIPITDASLTNPSKVMLIYSRIDVQGAWSSGGIIWNREHVWPQSVGWKDSTLPGYDLHHLRPEDPSVNSSRGNNKFGKVTNGSLVYLSANNGRLSSNCYSGGSLFEPQNDSKGDVARILFYMMIRYKSQLPGNGINVVATSMTLLLEWNILDPVDEWEMTRNDLTHDIQGNRNPFIDYSYLANQIWG